jgi:hypothetical protein
MLDDLDRTLKHLLEASLPPDLRKQITITFAAPDGKFPPSAVALPAIDLFLYDIRENRDLRSVEPIIERLANGRVTERRAPVRVDCSYLITAWTTDGPDSTAGEHGLLGHVLRVLVRAPVIPAEALQGALRGDGETLPLLTLQAGRLQSIAELWQAAGGRPKAALHLTVTVPVWTSDAEPVHTVTERHLRFVVGTAVES